MLQCNLAILLAERKLKISKVSADTGLSRTTLTALCNNYSQGIQFDTLNELCLYLDVTADELITFVPVDICITDLTMSPHTGPAQRELGIYVNIRDRHREIQACHLTGYVTEQLQGKQIKQIDIIVDVDNTENEEFIKQSFQILPRSFYPALEKTVDEKVMNYYADRPLVDDVRRSYTWSDNLMRRSGR